MKPSTEIAIAYRNIGERDSPVESFHGPLSLAIPRLIKWLTTVVMARRIQIEIGRSLEEVVARFESSRDAKATAVEDLMAEVESMLAASPDDWTPPTLEAPQ